MIRCFLSFICCAALAASASVQTPQAGAVRFANGTVYPMLGLPRSFVAGTPIAGSVRAAAFGSQAGIVATESGLEIVDFSGNISSHFEADTRQAVVAIEDTPSVAIAWLPASSRVVAFAAGEWRTTLVTTPLPGTVVSLRRVSKDTLHLLLSEEPQIFEVTVGLASGNVLLQRLIPEAKAPVTYLADGLLFQDGDTLVFESPAAGKKTLRYDGHIAGFEQMSAQAVHATESASEAQWMFELTPEHGLSLAQLPTPAISLAGGSR